MKKLFALLAMLLVCALAFAAIDFTDVDTTYDKDLDDQKVYETLKDMLSKATDKKDKAEVLWRLSRVCVDLGDNLDDNQKDAKFAIYEEGENYAIQSIEAYPTWEAYLWKCSNIGRWGQTKGVLNSLAKAKPMMADLKVITDDFKCVESSEAWYVLAILFDSLPGMFGGDSNAAISYGRVACDTIPANQIYAGTYMDLAEMLYNRNWDAKKRSSEIAKMQKNWNKETKSNYAKYAYYEGAKGADATPLWTNTKLSAMSDRQEALVILKYAKAVYDKASYHTAGDDKKYAELLELIAKWS
ncbi:MAG: hypothetical protein MJ057_07820 [Sphaerochaetaceae bacterium]|nr:hypothetical protein [Sphaerochaetaceae bacterium]